MSMNCIPHDNRLLVKKTDENVTKLTSGLYAMEQGRRWQEGVVLKIGNSEYAQKTFKEGDFLMYFNPIEVVVDGKVLHLVDCSNVLMWMGPNKPELVV